MKKFLTLTMALFMLLAFSACEEEEQNVTPEIPQDELLSIEETLQSMTNEAEDVTEKDNSDERRWNRKRPRFRTLITALVKTRLISTVAKNKLTVLAPTDEAFARIGITPWNVGRVENLEEILLYHVLGGKVRSTDLTEGFVPTVNRAAVEVSLDGGVFFNDAEVVLADIHALNGIIHVIDQVLMPPTATLWEIVEGNDSFSILQTAIETAGLVGVLDDPNANFTVFAPTDDAFVALLSELGLTAEQLLALPNLDVVLLYHVLGGRVFSSDLSDGLTVEMTSGEDISFDLDNAAGPSIIDVNGRAIPLNTGLLNIQANNGVAHVIDRVLLPTL
jgi:transforming growth factor-beta-induced protein